MQPLQFLLYWFTKVQVITLGSRMTEIYKATDGHLWFKKKKLIKIYIPNKLQVL